ncbi:DUF4422 domain-containing protein [uncultured Draconibacterium sp.]|uniref:DUF4422 domain-containing protein n=1 Tax=uncultured Draconibacterium sp. TaxID=1573823 RepID=UPI00321648A1
MSTAKIYVACHQKERIPDLDPIYIPLQVGKVHSKIESGFIADDSGINISEKNPFYSELTGWYWIWKNQQHKIVGTSHYRRYFTTKKSVFHKLLSIPHYLIGIRKKRIGLYYTGNIKKWHKYILSSKEIKEILKDYDIILPISKVFKYSVAEQYTRRHRAEDIVLTRTILSELQPEYVDSFDAVFNANKLYSFNMFVTRWELFEEYMNWLFALLFELEKRSDFPRDDAYQKRLPAFMAERLQTVWLHKKQLKTKELPVIYFKKNKKAHF